MTMYDVLVLGGGPAGLQAALSISRHFRTVALIYADPATMPFRNAAASHMHNVLGYDHTPPEEYRAAARAQLVDRYSQTLRVFGQNRIVAASKVDRLHESSQLQLPTAFQVQDEYGQTWLGRKLVLATGCQDRLPEYIVGFNEAWGKAIYHCLFCHGFEERGAARNGSLITVHESATIPPVVHTLAMALRFARHHTLFTNGAPPNFLAELAAQPDVAHMLTTGKTRIDNRKIAAFRLMEGEKVTKDDDGHELEITFDDGDHGGDASHATVVKFLSYLATPVLSPTSQMLAAALGVKVSAKQDAMLVRDFLCETSCPGVFAAGDVGGPAKAVVNGVFQGAGAGAGACMQLALEDVRLQRMSAPDVLSSEALGITGAGARLETAPATGEQSRA